MTSGVVFTPEAEEQLVDLYHYIAAAGSPEAAARYTDSIVTFCEEFWFSPHGGYGNTAKTPTPKLDDRSRSRLRTRPYQMPFAMQPR